MPFCGISNALFTTLAMEVSPYSRSISSGTYNFLRWSGAALAPIMSGLIGQQLGMQIPFFIAALLLVVGVIALFVARPILERALLENGEPEASHAHHLATTTQSI